MALGKLPQAPSTPTTPGDSLPPHLRKAKEARARRPSGGEDPLTHKPKPTLAAATRNKFEALSVDPTPLTPVVSKPSPAIHRVEYHSQASENKGSKSTDEAPLETGAPEEPLSPSQLPPRSVSISVLKSFNTGSGSAPGSISTSECHRCKRSAAKLQPPAVPDDGLCVNCRSVHERIDRAQGVIDEANGKVSCVLGRWGNRISSADAPRLSRCTHCGRDGHSAATCHQARVGEERGTSNTRMSALGAGFFPLIMLTNRAESDTPSGVYWPVADASTVGGIAVDSVTVPEQGTPFLETERAADTFGANRQRTDTSATDGDGHSSHKQPPGMGGHQAYSAEAHVSTAVALPPDAVEVRSAVMSPSALESSAPPGETRLHNNEEGTGVKERISHMVGQNLDSSPRTEIIKQASLSQLHQAVGYAHPDLLGLDFESSPAPSISAVRTLEPSLAPTAPPSFSRLPAAGPTAVTPTPLRPKSSLAPSAPTFFPPSSAATLPKHSPQPVIGNELVDHAKQHPFTHIGDHAILPPASSYGGSLSAGPRTYRHRLPPENLYGNRTDSVQPPLQQSYPAPNSYMLQQRQSDQFVSKAVPIVAPAPPSYSLDIASKEAFPALPSVKKQQQLSTKTPVAPQLNISKPDGEVMAALKVPDLEDMRASVGIGAIVSSAPNGMSGAHAVKRSSRAVPIVRPPESAPVPRTMPEVAGISTPPGRETTRMATTPPGLPTPRSDYQATFDELLTHRQEALPSPAFNKASRESARSHNHPTSSSLEKNKNYFLQLMNQRPASLGKQALKGGIAEATVGELGAYSSTSEMANDDDIPRMEAPRDAGPAKHDSSEDGQAVDADVQPEADPLGSVNPKKVLKKRRKVARDALLTAWGEREVARNKVRGTWSLEGMQALEALTLEYNQKRRELEQCMGSGQLNEEDSKVFPALSVNDLAQPQHRPHA